MTTKKFTLRLFACLMMLAITGCTTITYPVKARGYIVTDTPCPQDPSKRIIYREHDKELACYSLIEYRGDTYISAGFEDGYVWVLFYKGAAK